MKLLSFFVLLSTIIGLTSCKPTESIRVLQPAAINLPSHVSSVAVVDRTKPSSGWANFLEGLISGEQIGQDRESREVAIQKVISQLAKTPRLTVKNSGIELESSKSGAKMPPPLEWSKIEDFCAQTGSNMVLVVESFDSDNAVRTKKNEQSSKDSKTGKSVTTTTWGADLDMTVRIGWRLYDPKQKILLDEFVTNGSVKKSSTGAKTESEARNKLPDQIKLARDLARQAGEEYGRRIAPSYITVNRTYYHKAKGFDEQMGQGKREAESGQWEKASSTWQSIIKNAGSNQAAAGRAAYNIALSYEVRGDLDEALTWAQKAYTQYGDKMAKGYTDTLRQRQNDARKAAIQMNGKKV